jgi:hypothetical protein
MAIDATSPSTILGALIIIINILPLIYKKPKYLILTGLLSVLAILGFKLLGYI